MKKKDILPVLSVDEFDLYRQKMGENGGAAKPGRGQNENMLSLISLIHTTLSTLHSVTVSQPGASSAEHFSERAIGSSLGSALRQPPPEARQANGAIRQDIYHNPVGWSTRPCCQSSHSISDTLGAPSRGGFRQKKRRRSSRLILGFDKRVMQQRGK